MASQTNISETIERARVATQSGAWQEAADCWNAVLANDPDYAAAYPGAGNALRELQRFQDAERVLGQGAKRFPNNEQIAIARAWLANAQQDWPTALSRWDEIRVRFPNSLWGCLGSMSVLRNAGQSDRADEMAVNAASMLAAARQRGLDAAIALAAEVELAKASHDWSQVQRAAREIVEHQPGASAKVFLMLAQAGWHMGEMEEADGAAIRALSIDPKLADAVVVRAWVATNRGDGEAALSCYRTLVELNPSAVRWPLKVIQLLNRSGRVAEALAELEIVRGKWPNDPMVRMFLRNYGPAAPSTASEDEAGAPEDREPESPEIEELQRVFEKSPGPTEWIRPLIVADPRRDVLLGQVPESKAAVLVFTGSNDAVSLPLSTFDRYLATLSITAVYLKDFKRLRYLRGIQSLSEDYIGTLAALRDMLGGLGIERLCTLGNCDGGFAAIRYGVELGADRIVTFGAPTFSPKDSLSKIEQARNFMRNRLDAHVPGEMTDLRPFLEARQHGARIELFYEQEDERDRHQTLRIADLPGVHLHPEPGLSNHYLLRKFALTRDDFSAMLGELLGITHEAAG